MAAHSLGRRGFCEVGSGPPSLPPSLPPHCTADRLAMWFRLNWLKVVQSLAQGHVNFLNFEFWAIFHTGLLYKGVQNDVQNIVKRTQAGQGKAGKQQQEQTSPNLERTIKWISVLSNWLNIRYCVVFKSSLKPALLHLTELEPAKHCLRNSQRGLLSHFEELSYSLSLLLRSRLFVLQNH